MRLFKIILSLAIFCGLALLCFEIIEKSAEAQRDKVDYAEINHIKYGLFSVNEWKGHLAGIVTNEISKLSITKTHKKLLKKHIQTQLDVLIDNVAQKIKDANRDTVKGKLKQFFIKTFVDIKAIKKGIPEYADQVIALMTKTENENKIRQILRRKVKGYLNSTFETQDMSKVNAIVERLHSEDIKTAKIDLSKKIDIEKQNISEMSWLLIGLSFLLFLINGFDLKPLAASQFFILLMTLCLLLTAGIMVPMIDMEAKISEMSFVLLGHPIEFFNQVFYFQSKSILDVFRVMMEHKELEMKVVGVFVVTFSLIFPLLKTVASIIFYFDFAKLKNNKIIQFFVLKAGKWSMTDVLVVAIFMAYIGMNGMVSNQLDDFNTPMQDATVLTTNGTSLQPGFYIFLFYTVLGLFLSGFLTRKRVSKKSISKDPGESVFES